jgi:DNA mismatch endonuclease, patch repair protein
MMAGIGGRNTQPELVLRRGLHRAGLRFRLHDRTLPGRPDIVLPRFRAAILVHGCFWHRHEGCRWCSTPSSNIEFWSAKFENNVSRDRQTVGLLSTGGWRVALVWECALRRRPTETVREVLDWLHSASDSFETEIVQGELGQSFARTFP